MERTFEATLGGPTQLMNGAKRRGCLYPPVANSGRLSVESHRDGDWITIKKGRAGSTSTNGHAKAHVFVDWIRIESALAIAFIISVAWSRSHVRLTTRRNRHDAPPVDTVRRGKWRSGVNGSTLAAAPLAPCWDRGKRKPARRDQAGFST